MAVTVQPRRFMGVDISTLGADLSKTWQVVSATPLLGWISPSVGVKLILADGSQESWEVGSRFKLLPKGSISSIKLHAREIPESLVLIRHLAFAGVSPSELAQAVELEARSTSPFSPDDLVWGYGVHPVKANAPVVLIQCSRKQVLNYLQGQTELFVFDAAPELWVKLNAATPIVLRGFGELSRAKSLAFRRNLACLLLGSALLLALAMALTPSAQLRMRGQEAQLKFITEQARTLPVAEKRARYLASLELLDEVARLSASRVDPLWAMDRLTQIIPDDTSVQSVQVNGSKIALTGLTSNAATLMQHLSTQEGIREVKAPAPATRALGLSKDSFNIEFSVSPRPVSSAPAPLIEASGPANSIAATATATATATSGTPTSTVKVSPR